MKLAEIWRLEWRRNRGHARSQCILFMFRLCAVFVQRRGSLVWVMGLPLLILYRILCEYLLGVELKPTTHVGPGLRIHHGIGLVVNHNTTIGRNVTLRHCTTIGCKEIDGGEGPSPTIGDDVDVGSNVVILGGITIGSGAKIGAGSVVVEDIPAGATAVGNPAKVLSP